MCCWFFAQPGENQQQKRENTLLPQAKTHVVVATE
jgi:hypothetical protein